VAARRRATLRLRRSVMSAAFKEMPVAMRGHPFGASQMTLPGAPRPIGFTGRIDVQHDAGHFGPIRAFGVGIEQTQIRDEMFVVISVRPSAAGAWSATGGSSGGLGMIIGRAKASFEQA
jgi:hypothetical protein